MSFDDGAFCLVSGFSMLPLLRNGDRVRLRPVNRAEVRPGDVVGFYAAPGGQLVVHRVIRTEPAIVTQGDANSAPDPPLSPELPLARLEQAERDGQCFIPAAGEAGLAEFRRNQRARRRRAIWHRFARTVCRLSPWKVREHQLQPVEFNGGAVVYYYHDRAIGTWWGEHWLWFWPPAPFFIKRPSRDRGKLLFRLAGAIAADEASLFYAALSPAERARCHALARAAGLSSLLYYLLHAQLDESTRRQFQADYYRRTAWELRDQQTQSELKRHLEQLGIPYMLLKGAFFAPRLYPTPATRFRTDLDLLVRREDAESLYLALLADGWQPVGTDHRKHRPLFYRHHLPPLNKPGRTPLEIHWHIFKDISSDPTLLWRDARLLNGFEYELPPELHCLLLIYNMYYDRWNLAARSLLDLALLRNHFPISPERLDAYNRETGLNLDLGLPAAAFPEVFPPPTTTHFASTLSPAARAIIRTLAALDPAATPARPGGKWFRRAPIKRNRTIHRLCLRLNELLPRFRDLPLEARRSHLAGGAPASGGQEKTF